MSMPKNPDGSVTTGLEQITVYGPRPQGGRNLGVRVGAVDVLLSPDGEASQVEAERLATNLLAEEYDRSAHEAEVRVLKDQVEYLLKTLTVARMATAKAEATAIAAMNGRRRFFGPVLMTPVEAGNWNGAIWLMDPEKRERGQALRFANLAEVRQMHPELWVVRVEADGVLLDAWGQHDQEPRSQEVPHEQS